nr:dipicolinate synthase subunit B [Oscillospiraceae bacterium]
MNIGFALCGSFCTYAKVLPIMELLTRDFTVTPILSDASYTVDTRFGTAQEHMDAAREICNREVLHTLSQVEPIGPKKLFDILVIAPCTGNTLAKLAHGIADGPVTMAAKSHLRNGRPVLIAISTNDALGAAAENIGKLLARKHFYFVPFGQDDPFGKPTSMVADFGKIPLALEAALEGRQMQPILL